MKKLRYATQKKYKNEALLLLFTALKFAEAQNRHCSELGRLVLNMCIPIGLFTLKFSLVHAL